MRYINPRYLLTYFTSLQLLYCTTIASKDFSILFYIPVVGIQQIENSLSSTSYYSIKSVRLQL